MKLLFRQISIYLFFMVGIGMGFYKYGFQRIYHAHSQWDLKTDIAATQRVVDVKTQFDPDFTQRAYLPPLLPVGLPLFHLLGKIEWKMTRLIWVVLSSILIILMVYLTSGHIKEIDPNFGRNALGVILLLVFLFKGTFLALAAGQISILVIFLLILFVHFQNKSEVLPALLLALATFKLNLAGPFFLYLLLVKKYRHFFFSAAVTFLLNFGISFAYLGPVGHLEQLWGSLQKFDSVSQNSYLLMAKSGRVDLAPFLAVFGIEGISMHILQAIIFVGALTVIVIYRRQMTDRLLLFNSIALFYAISYYRDYDLPLLLLAALPLIWVHRDQFQWWHILLFFPAVLPIQRIYEMGINIFPEAEVIFNLIGTSMIMSVSALAVFLNMFQRWAKRRYLF